jgi:hypothetical protein
MNTRKIVIGLDAGMVGTDSYEFWEVPDTATDDELYELCWERAKNHAEMYGIYPREEYAATEDFDEDEESYSDSIEGWFEDYNPSKHDGHRVGGDRSWQEY